MYNSNTEDMFLRQCISLSDCITDRTQFNYLQVTVTFISVDFYLRYYSKSNCCCSYFDHCYFRHCYSSECCFGGSLRIILSHFGHCNSHWYYFHYCHVGSVTSVSLTVGTDINKFTVGQITRLIPFQCLNMTEQWKQLFCSPAYLYSST